MTGLEHEAHILVVDDGVEAPHLLAGLLRENGCLASLAQDGREMLETLAAQPFDLIILDLMLSGTSGLDLCRALRARCAVPIIMLTAKGDGTDRIIGIELGADDYVAEPFNSRELLHRVRAILRRANARGKPDQPIRDRNVVFAGQLLDMQ